jgi:hypothetical protein
MNIGESEKEATAEYFATLHDIQEKVRAERDEKKKSNEVNENG